VWQTPGSSSPWDAGYVGSFHRNDERGARYMSGANTGPWSVRIVSGLDWIKIDANPKNWGDDILSEPNPYGLGGFKKEVEEVHGGFITGSGNITFRVGMKSVNPNPAQPRYGLILITRSGGVAWFYVRQGEAADFLYRPTDPRVVGGVTLSRAGAQKWSPYGISDPGQYTTALAAGRDVLPRGGVFADYPSQIGYFFQWNRTIAYQYKVATSPNPFALATTFDPLNEVCPPGYRQAPLTEWIQSLYWRIGNVLSIVGGEAGTELNYLDGHYADGFYDHVIHSVANIEPVPTYSSYSVAEQSMVATGTPSVGAGVSGPFMAMRGVLMVNHYNYAAVFFPTISALTTTGTLTQIGITRIAMSDRQVSLASPNTAHWGGFATGAGGAGHIGVNCSSASNMATPVRCVAESW